MSFAILKHMRDQFKAEQKVLQGIDALSCLGR